jgi:hypothetical protein
MDDWQSLAAPGSRSEKIIARSQSAIGEINLLSTRGPKDLLRTRPEVA